MPYDTKCLDLAQYFLGADGHTGDAIQASLAQQIQDAVEDWFVFHDGGEQVATQVPDDASSKQAPAINWKSRAEAAEAKVAALTAESRTNAKNARIAKLDAKASDRTAAALRTALEECRKHVPQSLVDQIDRLKVEG